MTKSRARALPPAPVPPAFLERMRALLGDEYDAFAEVSERPPAQGLRVNTLKIEPQELARRMTLPLTPLPWSEDGFVLDARADDARPGKHPYHAAGLYYLQDPAAMAPVELLDPKPGETILDLAAAPGGKSTHLASRLEGEGLLVSNEVSHKRAWELAGNLERWGATNVAITNETPVRLAEHWAGFFDAVLLDAPCSGEAMFRKSDAARRAWGPALVEGCAVRQRDILEQAGALVKPGGRLVYSTCAFAPEENEGAIGGYLDAHPEFELAQPPVRRGFSPGRPEWLPAGSRRPELARCVRLWPHLAPGDGHFAALLRKSERDGPSRASELHPRMKLPRSVEAAYAAFVDEAFTERPAGQTLMLAGSYLYAVPPGMPDLTGLRYLHPGWWLGEVKAGTRAGGESGRERFEPSHALALAAQPLPARRVAAYSADDPDLFAYLRGETVPSDGDDGWVLVCADGYSIGWAKRVAGRLKSHYPKGLRH